MQGEARLRGLADYLFKVHHFGLHSARNRRLVRHNVFEKCCRFPDARNGWNTRVCRRNLPLSCT